MIVIFSMRSQPGEYVADVRKCCAPPHTHSVVWSSITSAAFTCCNRLGDSEPTANPHPRIDITVKTNGKCLGLHVAGGAGTLVTLSACNSILSHAIISKYYIK